MDTSDDNDGMMATGGSSATNSTSNGSLIDPSDILLQFQCLGTNDHDSLVNEFVRLLGTSVGLSREAATFFLEMNNWNLQSAIGSYFDYDAPRDIKNKSYESAPEMTLIRDVTVGDGEEVTPNTRFKKTWKIQNSGQSQWPWGTSLRFLAGTNLSQCDCISVDALLPGQVTEVSLEMVSPSAPGVYEGQYRMVTFDGVFFGETIWVIITVSQSGLLSLTQQLNSLSSITDQDQAHQHPNQFALPHDAVDGDNSMETVPILHNVTLDRVKSVETPADVGDNLENCIRRCNVLTTYPSPSTPLIQATSLAQLHAVTIPSRRDSLGKQVYSPSSSQSTCSPRASTLSSSPLAFNSIPNGHTNSLTSLGHTLPSDSLQFTINPNNSPITNGNFNQPFMPSMQQVNNNNNTSSLTASNEANTNGSSQFPPTPPHSEDMVL